MDTSQARANILARIRRAQGRPEAIDAQERARIDAYLAAHPRGATQRPQGERVAEFTRHAEALSATVETLAAEAELPQACARYLKAHRQDAHLVVNARFLPLDWASAGIEVVARVIEDADRSSLTAAYAGIAETGTVAFLSSPDTPASNNLLPDNHLVVLEKSRILASMEDVFDRIRHDFGELPRALNFVSGPSRTGDIEQTIVLGAHGPYRVHILLVPA